MVQELKYLNMTQKEICVLFNYEQAVPDMFYTNFTIYPFIPDDETINELKRKGYTVYMDDHGGLSNKNVIYLKLHHM